MTPVLRPNLGAQETSNVYAAFFDRHASLTEILKRLTGVKTYVSLKQVHGAKVITFDAEKSAQLISENQSSVNEFEADACVTRSKGVLLSVHTADCVPLLAAAGDIIGACHAGWRGVSSGVVENFIAALGALGARKEELRVALGPAIGPCHFEVKKDVGAQLVTKDIPPIIAQSLKRSHADTEKEYVDLRELIRYKLMCLRLSDQNLIKSEDCTYCDAQRFYSFRRESAQKGRLEAVILNPP